MNDNSKAHVNDVIKTMLERSSIRAYTDEKLTQEQISLLRNAALSAPTAMNAQDQRFVFVTNAEIIAELEAGVVEAACAGGDAAFAERIKQRGGKIMYDAPLFVGIFAHSAKFSGVDAGIAVRACGRLSPCFTNSIAANASATKHVAYGNSDVIPILSISRPLK